MAERMTNTGTASQENMTSLGKDGRGKRGDGKEKSREVGAKKGEIRGGQTHSFRVDKTPC